MDFKNRTVTGSVLGSKFTLRCPKGRTDGVSKLMLTLIGARRAIRKGCRSFLVNVTHKEDPIPDLDPAVPAPVRDLLHEYADVVPKELHGLPPLRPGMSHTIPLEDPNARPPSRPLYRLSRLELAEAERQVRELLEKGDIEPSSSPYGAPILFVHKKDGSLRMVID